MFVTIPENEKPMMEQERPFALFQQWMREFAEQGYDEARSLRIVELVEQWAGQGNNRTLLQAVEWAEAHLRIEDHRTWNGINHTLERIDASLAQLSTGSDTLSSLYQLITQRRGQDSAFPRNPRLYGLRYYMAVMAATRRQEELIHLMEHGADDPEVPLELLSLLLCESVVQRKCTESDRAVRDIHLRMTAAGHPLSTLPLTLTEVEQDLPLRHYNRDGGGGHSTPFGPKRRQYEEYRPAQQASTNKTAANAATGAGTGTGQAIAIAAPEEVARLQAATLNWCEQSNGKTEAAVFRLPPGLEAGQMTPDLLLSLGLNCLQGAAAGQVLTEPMSPSDTFRYLYSAAANGGAYNYGRHNAYGRLDAWTAFGALAGASGTDDADSVIAQANRCAWLYFEAPTSWFRRVAWDFGIVALRPDGQTLAVLAATDTD